MEFADLFSDEQWAELYRATGDFETDKRHRARPVAADQEELARWAGACRAKAETFKERARTLLQVAQIVEQIGRSKAA